MAENEAVKTAENEKRKAVVTERHLVRFYWPLIGSLIAGSIIHGQGARLTDRYWVILWLIGLTLLLFLPVRWQELKLRPKSWQVWWPLGGFLVLMTIMYFQGTRLYNPWILLWLLSLAMFVAMGYREIGRWFQNWQRKLRKQPVIEVEEPKSNDASNWWPSVIAMIAAIAVFILAFLPIYLTTPARALDDASAEAALTQHCILVAKDVSVIKNAVKAHDSVALLQYHLLKENGNINVSYTDNVLSNLDTRRVVCQEKGIMSILVG